MFKPTLLQNATILTPTTNITEKTIRPLIAELISKSSTLKGLNQKILLISLNNSVEFDTSSIKAISNTLKELEEKTQIITGICNYSSKQFEVLKANSDNSIVLFKSLDIALFLLRLKNFDKDKKILVYEKDPKYENILTTEIASRGYEIESVHTPQELKSKIESKKYLFAIYETRFDIVGNFMSAKIKNSMIFYYLFDHVHKNLSTYFNISRHMQRVQTGYKVFIFSLEEADSVAPKAIDFINSLALGEKKEKVVLGIYDPKAIVEEKLKDNIKRSGVLYSQKESDFTNNAKLIEISSHVKKKSGLTKSLVTKLTIFTEATVETFETTTGSPAKKTSHKISKLAIDSKEQIFTGAIKFSGDVDGNLYVAFPKHIVNRASVMLVGEESKTTEELLDIVKEFANIISGKVKSLLAQKDVSISISIPTSYFGLNSLKDEIGDKDGVLLEFLLDGEKVYIFLTY